MDGLTGARGWVGALALLAGTALVVGVVVARGPGDAGPATTTTRPASTTTAEPASTTTTAGTTTTPPPTTTTAPSTTAPVGPAIAVRRGDPNRMVVALTFDAGSDVGRAAEILDVLVANDVTATFGMTGRWAAANPALVARMAREGHQLVNHSYDHPSFTGRSTGEAPLSREARLDQLARTEAAIAAAGAGPTQPWFRPPYGDEDEGVRADVGAAGYRYELLWTVDSLGWKGLAPAEVQERCLAQAVPGAIILMHVGIESTDHAALQAIINGLRARGYTFVTATGLIT